MMNQLEKTVGIVALLSLIVGCTEIKPVQPWEKGVLSRDEMRFDVDAIDSKNSEQIYSSKESATGGSGIGGGGCGCN